MSAFRQLLFLGVLGLAACGNPADGGAPDATIRLDGSLVPATLGAIDVSFELDATGQGTDRLGSISVVKNVSDRQFPGVKHTGFAYQDHPPFGGYLIYDVISIAEDGSDFAVTYLYCRDGALDSAYTEGLLEEMSDESATGTCAAQTQTTHVAVDMPPLAITPGAMDTGMTITGSSLNLGPAGGTVELGGESYSIAPFNTVDCSTCPGGSWYEIHSMLMRPQQACFAIFYLTLGQTSTVQLAFAICLPSLEQPADTTFDATWSGTLLTRPPPPPPPGARRSPKLRPLPPSLLGRH